MNSFIASIVYIFFSSDIVYIFIALFNLPIIYVFNNVLLSTVICFINCKHTKYCSFLINSSDDKLSREVCMFNLDFKISTNALISSIVYIIFSIYYIIYKIKYIYAISIYMQNKHPELSVYGIYIIEYHFIIYYRKFIKNVIKYI